MSTSRKDIQRAAAKAAEAFRPAPSASDGQLASSSSSMPVEVTVADACDVDYYRSMAEGLMVDPPQMHSDSYEHFDCLYDEGDDMTLWSYSI